MPEPSVSICIPTYCRYSLLRRAVDSAMAQTLPGLEIIISDNASEDGSWEKTRALAELDPRILVRRNSSNLGWTGNLNECIKAAKGKYLVFLCDDDELLPGMVQSCFEFMEANPVAGIVHTGAYYVTITGRLRQALSRTKPLLHAGIEALAQTLFDFNIAFSSVMARASCFSALGGFVESISSDYEMWVRIAARYDVGYVPRPLIRVYGHSISPKMTAARFIAESERLWTIVSSHLPEELRKQADSGNKSAVQLAAGLRSLGIQAVQAGYWQNGMDFFRGVRERLPGYGVLSTLSDVLFRALPRRLYILLFRKEMHSTNV